MLKIFHLKIFHVLMIDFSIIAAYVHEEMNKVDYKKCRNYFDPSQLQLYAITEFYSLQIYHFLSIANGKFALTKSIISHDNACSYCQRVVYRPSGGV